MAGLAVAQVDLVSKVVAQVLLLGSASAAWVSGLAELSEEEV